MTHYNDRPFRLTDHMHSFFNGCRRWTDFNRCQPPLRAGSTCPFLNRGLLHFVGKYQMRYISSLNGILEGKIH